MLNISETGIAIFPHPHLADKQFSDFSIPEKVLL